MEATLAYRFIVIADASDMQAYSKIVMFSIAMTQAITLSWRLAISGSDCNPKAQDIAILPTSCGRL
jgi:hypothetical protein